MMAFVAYRCEQQARRDLNDNNILRRELVIGCQIETLIETMGRHVVSFVHTGSNTSLAQTAELQASIAACLNSLNSSSLDEDTRAYVQKMLVYLHSHEALFAETVRDRNRRGEAYEQDSKPIDAAAADLLQSAREFRMIRAASIEQLARDMDSGLAYYAQFSHRLAVVAIALAVMVGVWITRTTARPLRTIVRRLEDLAAGNASDEIPHVGRRDEIGELAATAKSLCQWHGLVDERLAKTKREDAQLLEQQELARRKSAELDEFIYAASHDLQEPLRKVQSFSKLLRTDIGDNLSDEAKGDLRFILEAVTRMDVLVNDLLELCSSGRRALQLEVVSMERCVKDAMEALSIRIDEVGATIECGELPLVLGDRVMLTQLFRNLIGNALKFRSNERELLVEISQCATEDGAILSVRDNGIGIESQYADPIFTPFKRLHGRAEYEGSGIGLATCRRVVERHGGAIWVESEFGRWSDFRFSIQAHREVNDVDANAGQTHEEPACV